MEHECARPRPLAGARPLNVSNAGASDGRIIEPTRAKARPLPPELLEVADRIADVIAARIKTGGSRWAC